MREVLEAIYVWGRLNPTRPAIVLHDRLITYQMLVAGILSVEQKVASLKLDIEKLVGVDVENPARHLIVVLALAKAGYSTVSLSSADWQKNSALFAGTLLTDRISRFGAPPAALVGDDWFTLSCPLAEWHIARWDPYRTLRVVQTSGATGASKPIAHTMGALSRRINDVQRRLLTNAERVLIMFGLNGNAGIVGSLAALGQGRTAVYARSIEEAVQLIPAASVTAVFGSIQHLREVVRYCREYRVEGPFDQVKFIVTGGSYLSNELLRDLHPLFPCEIYQCYASTEAGPAGVSNVRLMRGSGGVARYVQCAEIKIDEAEGPEPGSLGRIAVRSSYMGLPFTGNLVQERGDEWFYPGDTGYIDPEGYLVVVGRSDELINIGGIKRSAEFLEAHYSGAPGVKDCAVVRIDGAAGPRIVLLVATRKKLIPSEIQRWGRAHPLGVAYDQIFEVESIPRNAMGKVERARVRQLAIGLSSEE